MLLMCYVRMYAKGLRGIAAVSEVFHLKATFSPVFHKDMAVCVCAVIHVLSITLSPAGPLGRVCLCN